MTHSVMLTPSLKKGGKKTGKWDMVSDETRSPQILMRYPHT